MYYFAYGSNMFSTKLQTTVGGMLNDLGIATLEDYSISFNKYSTRDRTGKTNIVPSNNTVWGVLYDLTADQFKKLDESEGGYQKIRVIVKVNNETIEAETYIAKEQSIRNNLNPTQEYRQFLIDGAQEHNFPVEYINMLLATPIMASK